MIDLEKRTKEQNTIIIACITILTIVIVAFNIFIFFK